MREGSHDGPRRGGTPERKSRRGTHGYSQELAIAPLRVVLDLLGESEGVSTQRVTRPALAGHVGSYSSDLVSSQRLIGYLEVGRLKALIYVVIGREGARIVGQ